MTPLCLVPLQNLRHLSKCLPLKRGLVAIPQSLFQRLVEALVQPSRTVPRVALVQCSVVRMQHQMGFRNRNREAFRKGREPQPRIGQVLIMNNIGSIRK